VSKLDWQRAKSRGKVYYDPPPVSDRQMSYANVPATEKQLAFLRHLGIPTEDRAFSKNAASAAIDAALAAARAKSPGEEAVLRMRSQAGDVTRR
jgi:hypothetical protein